MDEMISLDRRIGRLERQNRVMKKGLAAIALLGLITILTAANNQGELVRGQRLIVEDGLGNPRIVIDGGTGGKAPSFKMLDPNGEAQISSFKGHMEFIYKNGAEMTATSIGPFGVEFSKSNPSTNLFERVHFP